MKINKLRKYISWNLISLIGYLSLVVGIYFAVVFMIAASEIGMRSDLNKIFIDHITKHIVFPYLDFYKIQLTAIFLLLLISRIEKEHYKENEVFGLRMFEDSQKIYSRIFITGLLLNFMPVYFLSFILLKFIMMLH